MSHPIQQWGQHPPTRREFISGAAGMAALGLAGDADADGIPAPDIFNPDGSIRPPAWVEGITRMTFLSPSQLAMAAGAGAQVVHTNVIWPYFPLRSDGGGLSEPDRKAMRDLATECHRLGLRLGLGLPPFPPLNLVAAHPDWRIHPDTSGSILKVTPKENDLGTRNPCNLGPWGNYLIEVCGELVEDFGVDAFSFDGNYHPPICYCPACTEAYQTDRKRKIPDKADLDNADYREYLVWRGDRLTDHYRRLQQRIKRANPDAALMSWTVNAGRYGHFLTSPRAMPTAVNRVFDLPMQEWWLDESNQGGSVMPSFGAAYIRATTGDRAAASEPYLMTRGNPYGSDSFPKHERRTRSLLAAMSGGVLAESLGWPGQQAGVLDDFRMIGRMAPFLTGTTTLPWAALLVSEQTRQFYAYKDIADRFLPHVLGAYRAAVEEHLPVLLINDWDLNQAALRRYSVLILANAAALSDSQVTAVTEYVRAGGGLVASVETSLCSELGKPRGDFALAGLFGASYMGRPAASIVRPTLDENFSVVIDEAYWRQRVGVGTLSWSPQHDWTNDERLEDLAPSRSCVFRGPQARVSEPAAESEVVARLKPEGSTDAPIPGAILRRVGKGRVVYLAAGIDAAYWSYGYPYQRRLLARAIEWASSRPVPITFNAPMCVQVNIFEQRPVPGLHGRRLVVHLFNGINTTGGHGSPAVDVPLREEVVPIHGIEIRFNRDAPRSFTVEPGGTPVRGRRDSSSVVVSMPPLGIHTMLVGEY